MESPSRFAASRRLAAGLAAALLAASAQAAPWWQHGASGQEGDFLPPDVAFRPSVRIVGSRIEIRWEIARGYYLYRSKMQLAAVSPGLAVGPLRLPRGERLEDRYFGPQEIYRDRVAATAAVTRLDSGGRPVEIKLTYQGCAEAGLCYPPIVKVMVPDSASPTEAAPASPPPAAAATSVPPARPVSEWLAIGAGLVAFLAAGLLARRGRTLPVPDA